MIFPDHYDFNHRDIINIKSRAKRINANIITTEKDYVKIREIDDKEIDYLEISLEIKNEEKLVEFMKKNIWKI